MRRFLAFPLAASLLAVLPALAQDAAPVAVTVTARGCEPKELTVKAGRVTFLITNRSTRALEWEILKGVMIVDERENIAPGFKQRLSTTLEPGEYAVTCGLLSNPRGRLVVLNAQGGTASVATKPGVAELIGLSAEYRVWTASELDALASAVAAGERVFARQILLHLTPLNARATPQAVALDAALNRDDVDLAAPAAAYTNALRNLSVSPQALLVGLATMATTLANANRAETAALLAGIEAPAVHILPLVSRADPALAERITADLASLRAAVRGEGSIGEAATALSSDLSKLPVALGLS